MNKVRLFGIDIDNVTMAEALQEIERLIVNSSPQFITTPNVDHIVRLEKDPEFREVYRKAAMALPDSVPLVWASRLLGKPLKERVAGSDLVLPVCEMAAKKGYSLYFLGGESGVAEKAAVRLKARLPTIKIAGSYAPPFGFESDALENEKIVRQINQAKADILFVALGAPKQEKWIARHLPELDIKLGLCVGAGIDFIAGASRRAPEWMRPIGLEWIWRLLCEPRRLWRRYLVEDAAILPIFFKEYRHLKFTKDSR